MILVRSLPFNNQDNTANLLKKHLYKTAKAGSKTTILGKDSTTTKLLVDSAALREKGN